MKCYECGKEETLPFTCSYCNQQFCIEHRLPENHLCPQSPKRKANKFSSEGNYHFIRNPKYKQRKRLKRAVKIITSLVIITALGYCLWIAYPSIIQFISQYVTQQPTPTSTPNNPTSTPIEIPTQTPISPPIYTPTQTPTATTFPQNTDDEIEAQIFQLINEERINRGLPTLQNDTSLTVIAKSWCNQIAETQNLTHGNFTSRLVEIGIYTYGYQYGEIIESYGSTRGSPSVLARIFVDGWLSSTGHREIMLTALSGYMGVGVSRNGSTLYGVVDFQFMQEEG